MPGIQPIQAVKPILSEPKNPMPGVFMICTEMFGNGVMTGMMEATIKTLFIKIHRALIKGAPALSVAVRGSSMPCSAGPRIGTGSFLPSGGSTSTGFAALLQGVNNLLRIWISGIF